MQRLYQAIFVNQNKEYLTMWNATLQSKLVIFFLTFTCTVCLIPMFLTDEVTSNASLNLESAPAFPYHAASDTTDLKLWLIHLGKPLENSDPKNNLQNTSVRWIDHAMGPDSTISWTGLHAKNDTIHIQIQVKNALPGTLIEMTRTRHCSYFSRMWKWILSWQGSSLLKKNLAELETLVRQRADQHIYYGFIISETGLSPGTFAGYRATVHKKDVFRYFSLQIQNVYSLCQKQGILSPGRACLLRYAESVDTDSSEVFAGLPIPDYLQLAGTQRVKLPAGTFATTIAEGGEPQIEKARLAIRKYLADRNLTLKMPVVEEYIHESAANSDPSLWKTKIYAAYK